MVEIMKAINRKLEIVAFDEPTASLTEKEIDKLFEIINKLKQKGIIILYVSHRIKEIFIICDDVVVLKDGKFVDKVKTIDTSEEELVRKMVGRKLGDVFNTLERNKKLGDTILEAKNITTVKVKNASFDLKKGEILGLFGLVGAGRTELMNAIFGNDKIVSGEIFFEGKKIEIHSPERAIEHGIGFCPEDRKLQAIMPNHSVKHNISIVILKMLSRFGFINRKIETQTALENKKKLNIQTSDLNKRIIFLSGGNQQKVIVARWLAANPKVLILDEPTKGIDVGAKSEMYKIICDLAKEDIGIIFISSELPEMIGLCDRILAIKNGEIVGEVLRDEVSEEKLLKYAVL
ncbi:MAG: sugar ABC transporter ATP-binding protein [Actinobacteria bacterium]|nr:sugar ABC transporter ATP-binding protein [Actinomycetota bacterium]